MAAGYATGSSVLRRYTEIASIAVLPFREVAADPSEEYLVSGMTDALINELGQISGLRVTSSTSTMR